MLISELRLKDTYTGKILSVCNLDYNSTCATRRRKDFPTPRLPARTMGFLALSALMISRSLAVSTK